ncbi:MAG: OsmC family protein [Spirochaetaceae bacterium]
MKVTSRHVTGCYQSVVDDGRKHGLVLDLPEGKKGDDIGPTALELAAMALAGCISTIWAVVAHNSGVRYRKMVVELELEKPDSAPTFTGSKAHVKVDSDETQETLERILEKTKQACPVGRLFEQAGIDTPTTLEITTLIDA